MKEIKVLGVVVALTLLVYWGVEPFAHSQMHPHVSPADFEYKGMQEYDVAKGNSTNGKALVEANCVACHSITKDGYPQLMDNASAASAYGVVPPDLSAAGHIYNEKFLANYIKNPVKAFNTAHKFDAGDGQGAPFPMPNYEWMSDQEITDMVAYFKSIAPHEMDDKEVFKEACNRCHSLKYEGIQALTPAATVKTYMGKNPPDLSMMIRSRGHHFLDVFINDPQKLLHGTAMPRVGLTQEAQEQVIAYIEKAGDRKKENREDLGPKVLLYSLIFAIVAFLWKKKIWRDVH